MTILIFDTETTGLPVRGEADNSENQPWPLSIAAVLLSDDFSILEELNVLVNPPITPDRIDPVASKINGITYEQIQMHGVPVKKVLLTLKNMINKADMVTAYNVSFDKKIINMAAIRCGMKPLIPESKDTLCIMMAAQNVMGFRPKLRVAYRKLCGKEITCEHDAMCDTLAAMEVLAELIRRADDEAATQEEERTY